MYCLSTADVVREQVTICLTVFRDSFFSSGLWRHLLWKAESSIASLPFQTLLDVVFDLTPNLPGMKAFKSLNTFTKANAQRRLYDGCHFLEVLRRTVDHLEGWFANMVASQWPDQMYHSKAATWCSIPSFDEDRFSYTYTFPDFSIAMAVTFYDAVRIRVLGLIGNIYGMLRQALQESSFMQLDVDQKSVIKDVQTLLTSTKLYESATRICRSLEYFFDADKALIGPSTIMFPFHIAYSAFRILKQQGRLDLDADLEWCKLASAKFEAAKLPTLDSLDIGGAHNRIARSETDS